MHFLFWLPLLALISIITGQCNFSNQPFQMTGEVTGIACTNFSLSDMTTGQCVLYCHFRNDCQVAYQSCEAPGCLCVLCQGSHAIDFTRLDRKFYLKGNMVTTDPAVPPYRKWTLPGGGLKVGRVFIIRLLLSSQSITLHLVDPNIVGFPFYIRIDVIDRRIVRNSKKGKKYGNQESAIPYFNFTGGQEIELTCVVRKDEYLVYIDQYEFFTFTHRFPALDTISLFELIPEMLEAKRTGKAAWLAYPARLIINGEEVKSVTPRPQPQMTA
ncbi:galectin [Elysia marginata]|uniref:Galectin n=1 Tax=Elysia marginata TaxID=1093978 RepID=A0AAV4F4E1_9GAST|nr:galectin [Elysia marginata]